MICVGLSSGGAHPGLQIPGPSGVHGAAGGKIRHNGAHRHAAHHHARCIDPHRPRPLHQPPQTTPAA